MKIARAHDATDLRNAVLPFSIYAFYMFVFLLTELVLYDRTAQVMGSGYVTRVYALNLLFLAAGYLVFAFVQARFAGSLSEKKSVSFFVLVFVLTISGALLAPISSSFIYLSMGFFCMFSLGYLGGVVHYRVSLDLYESPCISKSVGFAIALAICMQYIVQNYTSGNAAHVVSLIMGATLLSLLMYFAPVTHVTEPACRTESRVQFKELLALIVLVALMSLIVGIKDGIVTDMHARGELNVSGGVRLLFAAGLMIAGIVGDCGERRYMGIATAVTLIFSTIATFFLSNPDTYAIALSVFYFYGGFYITYISVAFLEIAPETDRPALWAGMGRIVRSTTISLAAYPAAQLFSFAGVAGGTVVLVVNTVLTMVAIVVFFIANKFERKKKEMPAKEFDEKKFFAENAFTMREVEIFAKILVSDKNLKEIAGELYISERVLQRHLSSMYEKTGTNSRASLLRCYYESKKANPKP